MKENNCKVNEVKEVKELNDTIEWYEFQPVNDLCLVETIPPKSEKVTETGIVIAFNESVVMDRPVMGVVKAKGPKCKYDVGTVLFFQKQSGYDIGNIKRRNAPGETPDPENRFVVLHPNAILGYMVKDTRKKEE